MRVNQRFVFGIAKFGSLLNKEMDMSRRLLESAVRREVQATFLNFFLYDDGRRGGSVDNNYG